jgi:hypothetical protein
MSQVQVAMLFAFEFWILFKVIFWLALLWYLLPRNEEEQRFKLDPQRGTAADPKLTDRDRSFGLSALFRPYDIVVFMIALGAFYYALQIPNQTGVRAMLVDPATGSLWTRLLHLFALLITISVMVIGPIVGFAVIMGRWQKRRVKQLKEEEQRTDERRKNEIPAEIDLVNAQTTWPKRDKLFWAALLTVVVSVGPVVAQFAGVPENVRRFISVPGAIKYTVHTSVRKAYGLDNLDVKGE